ncbi:CDC27 family protein isoform X2 [Carex rostrata]
MEALMVEKVQSSLGQFMPRNALFLCERLCAQFPAEINQQLLATCYLQNNQAYAAYNILKGLKMPQSRYLFALSCYRMDLVKEAEAALCPPNEPNSEVPNGAAGHYLLGLVYRYTGRKKAAIEHFTQALTADPLLWVAYEELCALGAAKEAKECFGDDVAPRIHQQHCSDMTSKNLNISIDKRGLPSNAETEQPLSSHYLTATNHFTPYDTPSPTAHQISGNAVAPPPLNRNLMYLNNNALGADSPTKLNSNATGQVHRRKYVDESKLRKVSERLFESGTRRSTRNSNKDSTPNPNPSTTVNGPHPSLPGNRLFGSYNSTSRSLNALRSVTLRRGPNRSLENFDEGRRQDVYEEMWTPSENNLATTNPCSTSSMIDARSTEQDRVGGVSVISSHDSRLLAGIKELLELLRILGEGYRLSCLYRSQEALEVYHTLSEQHFNTGWVLIQVGKAYSELFEYAEADRFFDLAHRLSPHTLEGMDVYSTVLFHRKEEMRLSYLARELASIDRLSPQAWCAVGNCYSIQKDHETALKTFQRAVQLDPRFAYAHTLCGHEYTAMEDYENGIKCYMSALQVDERHYNAWYGLGVVYLRQEKFEFAEHHFRFAYRINPMSSVLMCYLGMALHSLKREMEAVEMVERAMEADPKNVLPIYQKAQIMVSLERYDLALEELHQLEGLVPKESTIFALMGKIYKHLNMHHKAMFYFGVALDLKPPAADVAAIKAAMEKLYLPDEMDDE